MNWWQLFESGPFWFAGMVLAESLLLRLDYWHPENMEWHRDERKAVSRAEEVDSYIDWLVRRGFTVEQIEEIEQRIRQNDARNS